MPLHYLFRPLLLARIFVQDEFGKLYINCSAIKCLPRELMQNVLWGGVNKLSIGENSFVSFDNFFDLTDRITIGSDVHIAMRCTFITSTHEIGPHERRASSEISAPIIIEDGCWIGGNVTVLPGVTIHKGAIIGAGSVVNKDCDSDKIYAGVPAREIRSLDEAWK